MIRLNGFFEVKDGVTETQVKALADELVEKSLKDEGNHGYDLFHSATRPDVYMFCETWESDDLLTKQRTVCTSSVLKSRPSRLKYKPATYFNAEVRGWFVMHG